MDIDGDGWTPVRVKRRGSKNAPTPPEKKMNVGQQPQRHAPQSLAVLPMEEVPEAAVQHRQPTVVAPVSKPHESDPLVGRMWSECCDEYDDLINDCNLPALPWR